MQTRIHRLWNEITLKYINDININAPFSHYIFYFFSALIILVWHSAYARAEPTALVRVQGRNGATTVKANRPYLDYRINLEAGWQIDQHPESTKNLGVKIDGPSREILEIYCAPDRHRRLLTKMQHATPELWRMSASDPEKSKKLNCASGTGYLLILPAVSKSGHSKFTSVIAYISSPSYLISYHVDYWDRIIDVNCAQSLERMLRSITVIRDR